MSTGGLMPAVHRFIFGVLADAPNYGSLMDASIPGHLIERFKGSGCFYSPKPLV